MANLHVKLPDELYADLQSTAERNYRSISAQIQFLVESWLKEERRAIESEALLQRIRQQSLRSRKPKHTAKSRATAGLRGLEPFIGAINLGHPTDADNKGNEGIDADLARAYAGEA